ncbi:expressed unknown protein [Seminavis robusta]|uniref:Uncharacterized protein n=1 Tax=Seminavis robusta TaxID=568900 RepID=A0A9N8DYS4_9STRA|nr:expressed unknown protein [Seminavis robusta]|eukprot:Sro483_g151980.1 n/a (224) ;mRNA; r:7415-8086
MKTTTTTTTQNAIAGSAGTSYTSSSKRSALSAVNPNTIGKSTCTSTSTSKPSDKKSSKKVKQPFGAATTTTSTTTTSSLPFDFSNSEACKSFYAMLDKDNQEQAEQIAARKLALQLKSPQKQKRLISTPKRLMGTTTGSPTVDAVMQDFSFDTNAHDDQIMAHLAETALQNIHNHSNTESTRCKTVLNNLHGVHQQKKKNSKIHQDLTLQHILQNPNKYLNNN